MIFSKIPGIQADFEELRKTATSGFVAAINVRWVGPEHLHSEFPEKWRNVYEAKNYFIFDPIFYWTLMNTGATRWSEVGLPDPHGVNRQAAEHGLVYGATVCVKKDGMRSFLSAARPDRELTEDEMMQLDAYLHKWVEIVMERPVLSDVELETLECLRAGLDQAEIATKLDISVSTVKKRLRKVRKLFNAATITEAISIATEKNYFTHR